MASKTVEQVKVTWEDQQNINTFSKLTMRRHELEALITGIKKQLQDLEDASAELMLADDEDDGGDGPGGVRMLVGASFLHTPKEDAEAKVDQLTEEAKEKLAALGEEMSSLQARMAELKVVLYGRLGAGNINLEE